MPNGSQSRAELAVVASDYGELAEPCSTGAPLTERQCAAMLDAALTLAGASPAGRGDRVVVKPNIVSCPGLSAHWHPGAVTDLRVVRGLLRRLSDVGCRSITIAEGAGGWRPAPVDGWNTEWGGEFAGLSYEALAREFGAELLDLNFAETIEHRAGGRKFSLAKAVMDCDRVISLSPLKTNKGAGVSLALKNLFGIAPGAVYGFPKLRLHALGPVPEVVVDVFAFRPDVYGILGGSWGMEGEGDLPIRHNVLIAGADAVAVDAVGAAVMGFESSELEFLNLARQRGMGCADTDAIAVRGSSIEQTRRAFKRPAQWEVACR